MSWANKHSKWVYLAKSWNIKRAEHNFFHWPWKACYLDISYKVYIIKQKNSFGLLFRVCDECKGFENQRRMRRIFSLQLTIKVGSGKSTWFSKSEKELWTSAGCQDYDNGKLQKSINEWGKGGVRLVHFSGKVIVGHLESEEIWLKRVKEQLMEAWIINFCYPFSFGVLKQPRKSLALADGWVGQTCGYTHCCI